MTRSSFNMTNLFPESFEIARKRLSERPELLRLFEKKGIKPQTVRKLMVWITDDWKIFFPLYGASEKNSFEVSGVIYFNEHLSAGVVSITKPLKWAYLGTDLPSSDFEAIIVSDPFEYMRLWQEGYDNVWCIPDFTKPPPTYKYWSRLVFLHEIPEDAISYFRECALATFDVGEEYMEGPLPEKAESRSRSILSNIIWRNPFQLLGKNYAMYRNGTGVFLIDEDFTTIKARAFSRDDFSYSATHPYLGEIFVAKSTVINNHTTIEPVKSEKEVYLELRSYIENNLYFLTDLQVLIITAQVMYLWRNYQDTIPFSFQILCRNEVWLTQIFHVIFPILPHGALNSGGSHIASIFNVERFERKNNILGAHIYLSRVDKSNFWYGIPLLVDSTFWSDDNRRYKNVPPKNLREKLFAYSIQFKWPAISDLPVKYQWLRPFELVLATMYTKESWSKKIRQIAVELDASRKQINAFNHSNVSNFSFFNNVWQPRSRLRLSKKSKITPIKRDSSASASTQEVSQ